MLNASAKAFVPGGAAAAAGSGTSLSVASKPFVPTNFTTAPPSWFRYHWSTGARPTKLAIQSAADFDVPSLFSKGHLAPAPLGGNAPNALQNFFSDHFDRPMNTGASVGILISRTRVAPDQVPCTLLGMDGFLVTIEAPVLITPPTDSSAGGTAGVNEVVSAAWDECFAAFGSDHRVQAMAHVTYAMGPSQLHYILLACTEKAKQIEVLSLQTIQSRLSARRASEIRRAMYFALAPTFTVGAVFFVGFSDVDAVRGHSQVVAELVGDVPAVTVESCSIDGLRQIEAQLPAARDAALCAARTRGVIPIIISGAPEGSASQPPMSHTSFIAVALRLLLDFGAPAVKFIGRREAVVPKADSGGEVDSSGLPRLWRYISRDYNAAMSDTLTSSSTFVIGSVVPPPAHVGEGANIPMSSFTDALQDLVEVHELLQPIWLRVQRKFLSGGGMLTKSKLGQKPLPHGDIRACRRASGARIFLVTDSGDGKYGRLFALCPKSGSTLTLPTCWSNPSYASTRSVFAATVSPSTLYEGQVRLIIDDVLMYMGNSVMDQAFGTRWQLLDASTPLDDENTWPHPSPCGAVVLKAQYMPFHQCRVIAAAAHPDHASCGLTVVNWDNVGAGDRMFSWVPADTTPIRFRAMKVEDVVEESEAEPGVSPRTFQVRRVHLGVQAPNSTDVPFNEEYADYLTISAPSLKQGDIVECMLRRASDGAHWWEVVNTPLSDRDVPGADRYYNVSQLVNDPSLTQEELFAVITGK